MSLLDTQLFSTCFLLCISVHVVCHNHELVCFRVLLALGADSVLVHKNLDSLCKNYADLRLKPINVLIWTASKQMLDNVSVFKWRFSACLYRTDPWEESLSVTLRGNHGGTVCSSALIHIHREGWRFAWSSCFTLVLIGPFNWAFTLLLRRKVETASLIDIAFRNWRNATGFTVSSSLSFRYRPAVTPGNTFVGCLCVDFSSVTCVFCYLVFAVCGIISYDVKSLFAWPSENHNLVNLVEGLWFTFGPRLYLSASFVDTQLLTGAQKAAFSLILPYQHGDRVGASVQL